MKSWNVDTAVFQDIKQESRETRMFICCVYRRGSWTTTHVFMNTSDFLRRLKKIKINKNKLLAQMLDSNFSTTVRRRVGFEREGCCLEN